jgi:hypothetical protein
MQNSLWFFRLNSLIIMQQSLIVQISRKGAKFRQDARVSTSSISLRFCEDLAASREITSTWRLAHTNQAAQPKEP